jgi:UDP-N-acetylmuramyl pentapeptide phosphotransferase/UDP-N-acetylglucosamine-1-phosphate transferase
LPTDPASPPVPPGSRRNDDRGVNRAALIAAITIGAGLAACVGTRALIPVLRRAAVLDRPNARSSHTVPTPRGGGIAVVVAILAAWLALIAAGAAPPVLLLVAAGAALLAVVSWLDDLAGLAPVLRLAAQFAAVGIGLAALRPGGALFQGWLPPWLDAAGAALMWLWFVNLFNFMDGIDGIAGSEAAAIGFGLMLFAAVGVGRDPVVVALAAPVVAAALGFLAWNWAPARVFLGDVGSVPLGYLLGFLLLGVAAGGFRGIALILPLYFLADATITLARRLLRGEAVWRPHRQHFYQRAVQRGLGHAAVVERVIAADIGLIGCGWAAENGWPAGAFGGAAFIVAALLASLAGLPGSGTRPIPAAARRNDETANE